MTANPEQVTARQAEWRYLVLSGLQWLPVGLVIPVMVLLLRARGLELPDIGALFALYSAVVIVLELPTGGVADVLGRRGTLIASRLLAVAALLGMAVARDPAGFGLAVAASAASRALQSGPLEAWYVDAVRAADPEAEVRRGIARAWAAEAGGLGIGAVTGGLLPGLVGGLPTGGVIVALSIPFLVAATVTVAGLVAVLGLMRKPMRTGARTTLGQIIRDVPRTVAAGLLLGGRDRTLRLVLAATVSFGFVLAALEVLSPVQFAALLGGEERASAAYGVLVTMAFFASAGGSALAPRTAGTLRSGQRAAALFTVLVAVALGGLAVGPTFLLVASLYVACYLFAGVAGPLRNEIVHHRVEAAQRATVLSAVSVSLHLGALVGALLVPTLATAGFVFGWLSAAVVAMAGAALLALLRPSFVDSQAGPDRRDPRRPLA